MSFEKLEECKGKELCEEICRKGFWFGEFIAEGRTWDLQMWVLLKAKTEKQTISFLRREHGSYRSIRSDRHHKTTKSISDLRS